MAFPSIILKEVEEEEGANAWQYAICVIPEKKKVTKIRAYTFMKLIAQIWKTEGEKGI